MGNPWARIFRYDELDVIDRGGEVVTRPLVSEASGAEAFISGITEMAASEGIRTHMHNCDEQVVVLSGNAEVEIAGETSKVNQFDSVYIKAGTWHRFQNSGTEPLLILWIYGCRDLTRTFTDGRTVGHLTREDVR